MKSRESLIRIHRFQVDEKRRRVVQIETMMVDFENKAVDLERQIEAEQRKAGIDDITHYAYPTFAKAAIARRDNIKASITELTGQLDEAKDELSDAFSELKRLELLVERENMKLKRAQMIREQTGLDEIAINRFRHDGMLR